jgi:hypothetical protein
MFQSSQLQHPVLLTPGEFARRVGRSPQWGAYVVAQGLVKSFKVGQSRAIPESEVERHKDSPPSRLPTRKPAA